MAEQVSSKAGTIRRMGQERWKYLDMANMSFAMGTREGYIACRGYLNAFLETIPDDTDAGKELEAEYMKIEMERRKQHKDLETQIEGMGYLEQNDYLNRGKEQIEIDTIYEQKTLCWTVSLKHALFNA